MDTISFNKKTLKQFKELYQESKKKGKKSFFFQGNEVLVSYAKYVIEYVESQLNNNSN